MTPPPDTEALLAHAGWVRGLALQLVRDAAEAEDLAQDTLVAALEHPPQRPSRGAATCGR
jgi:DNA-directed RNA polymerase specialized sigma24 family protein